MPNSTGSTADKYFDFNCPKGGDFYICENEAVHFIGCCTSDPCADGGSCPSANLRASSFDGDKYEELPSQDCDNSNSTKIWYTCAFISPPFLGCCLENPCGLGQCPQDSLVPAKLSDISTNARKILNPPGASASSSVESSGGNSGLSTGAMAGIGAGAGVAGLIILGLLIWFCWLLPSKKKKQEVEAARVAQQAQPQMTQPGSPGTFVPSETPVSHYQGSFSSSPVTAHYPSGATDMYGNKLSPYPPSYDRPTSMSTFSDVSAVPNRGYNNNNNGHSPVPMIPVQEMDGTSTPHEMSTGQEQFVSQNEGHDQQGHRNRTQSPPNHLGISS